MAQPDAGYSKTPALIMLVHQVKHLRLSFLNRDTRLARHTQPQRQGFQILHRWQFTHQLRNRHSPARLGQGCQGIGKQRLPVQAIKRRPEIIINLVKAGIGSVQVKFTRSLLVQGFKAQALDQQQSGYRHPDGRQVRRTDCRCQSRPRATFIISDSRLPTR